MLANYICEFEGFGLKLGVLLPPQHREMGWGADGGGSDSRQDDVTEQIMYLVIVIGNESGGRLGSS